MKSEEVDKDDVNKREGGGGVADNDRDNIVRWPRVFVHDCNKLPLY